MLLFLLTTPFIYQRITTGLIGAHVHLLVHNNSLHSFHSHYFQDSFCLKGPRLPCNWSISLYDNLFSSLFAIAPFFLDCKSTNFIISNYIFNEKVEQYEA